MPDSSMWLLRAFRWQLWHPKRCWDHPSLSVLAHHVRPFPRWRGAHRPARAWNEVAPYRRANPHSVWTKCGELVTLGDCKFENKINLNKFSNLIPIFITLFQLILNDISSS